MMQGVMTRSMVGRGEIAFEMQLVPAEIAKVYDT